jgi:hypothetical protein
MHLSCSQLFHHAARIARWCVCVCVVFAVTARFGHCSVRATAGLGGRMTAIASDTEQHHTHGDRRLCGSETAHRCDLRCHADTTMLKPALRTRLARPSTDFEIPFLICGSFSARYARHGFDVAPAAGAHRAYTTPLVLRI